jgi:general nucleoside transport system permease protein
MQAKTNTRWANFGFQILALVAALLFTTFVLILAGAPPLQAYQQLIYGVVGSPKNFPSIDNISNVVQSWLPLLITTAGLLVTFAAGLWNIGIEGQIIVGAIFATGLLRTFQNSPMPAGVILVLATLAGMLGGVLWASLAGALKTFGGVNEIFGGLGLNFVANALVLWLIYGPWRRPGVASLSGTEAFPSRLSLPTLHNIHISIWSLSLGIISIALIYILLRGTYIGLRLKAIGKNIRSAFTLGVPTWQYMMVSFMICGLFAGLTGSLQVTAVYHRLLPSISSGYGFLGLLVAMLINYQAIWVAPVALFYAALNIGSIQLPIALKLDSSLSGVLQGVMVLFVLLGEGVRRRLTPKA